VRLFKRPLKTTLPQHLRSYGVWVDTPARKGKKERVWRAERHFGYGPTEPERMARIFPKGTWALSPENELAALPRRSVDGALTCYETGHGGWICGSPASRCPNQLAPILGTMCLAHGLRPAPGN
jgi:hypothetical protein